MTFDSDGLLSTLNAPRPTERELMHRIDVSMTLFSFGSQINADCTCGWSFQSNGVDESSRNHVAAAVRRHEEKP